MCAPDRNARERRRDVPNERRPVLSTVLLAEDDVVIRALIARALEKRGHLVRVAEDGVEAVRLFREHHDAIDVVILDVRMPNLEGPAALAEMRVLRPDLPAVLLSGFARNAREIADLLKDGVRFVPKPIRASALADIITDHLARPVSRP